jgi:hypothetical protein
MLTCEYLTAMKQSTFFSPDQESRWPAGLSIQHAFRCPGKENLFTKWQEIIGFFFKNLQNLSILIW